ncbi:unnamed protein product [Lymnaea stagnalis]|uniref:EF-hand domain-containing protein n=1 Tax=Lymnaea stagnalis TaxID=6523 RepID=A0AAV2I9L6_LYMST
MHFICVFLILVPTLTLAQTEDLSDLTHYREAKYTFQHIDKNGNGFLELEELTRSFDAFKVEPSDSGVTREHFVDLLDSEGTAVEVAGNLFDLYDSDDNGVLTDQDYNAMQEGLDSDGDGQVREAEYIRKFNEILTNAGANVVDV